MYAKRSVLYHQEVPSAWSCRHLVLVVGVRTPVIRWIIHPTVSSYNCQFLLRIQCVGGKFLSHGSCYL